MYNYLLLNNLDVVLDLPVLHFGLDLCVLLHELVGDLFQLLKVGLEVGLHVLDVFLDYDTTDHSEAFSVGSHGFEGFQDESGLAEYKEQRSCDLCDLQSAQRSCEVCTNEGLMSSIAHSDTAGSVECECVCKLWRVRR